MSAHRVGELSRDITIRWRDIRFSRSRIVERVRLLRIEEREAIVMLRCHHRVTHARVFRDFRPLVGKPNSGAKEWLHLTRVFSTRHGRPVLNPLRVMLLVDLSIPHAARRRVKAKVNKHPEASLAPPRHALVAVRDPARKFVGF